MLKISIVTPSYNQGSFLAEAIESVLSQNYPNLEYFVFDGGSTDNSVETLKRYHERLTYWESTPDRGQTHAINKGFRRASGEIIAYLNSDDRYCDGVFHQIGDYFAKNPDCMWLAGNVLFTNASGTVLSRKKPIYTPFVLRYGTSSVYQPAVFVRSKVLQEVGLLDESFTAIMDQEWFCRIAEKYPPHIIDLDIACFRWHSKSKSSSGKNSRHYSRYLEEQRILLKRYLRGWDVATEAMPNALLWVLAQCARFIKLNIRVTRWLAQNSIRILH